MDGKIENKVASIFFLACSRVEENDGADISNAEGRLHSSCWCHLTSDCAFAEYKLAGASVRSAGAGKLTRLDGTLWQSQRVGYTPAKMTNMHIDFILCNNTCDR